MAAALGALVFPPVTSLPCLQVSRETGGEGSAHQAGLHRTGMACITQLAVTVSGTMAGLSCQRGCAISWQWQGSEARGPASDGITRHRGNVQAYMNSNKIKDTPRGCLRQWRV